jgi:quercetin dioxygenase-like cupin family protein
VKFAPGLWRTNLHRYDLSVPGREMIQSRVDIEPDSSPIRHTHPGEEIIYVLEGSLEYQVDGQPTRVYNAGEALTVPARVIHAVRNTGTGTGTHYRHRGKGQAAPHRGPVNAGWRTAVSTSCPFGQEGSRHG